MRRFQDSPRGIIGGGALFSNGGAGNFHCLTINDSACIAPDRIFGFGTGTDLVDLSRVHRGWSGGFGRADNDGGSFLFVDICGDGYNVMLIHFHNATVSSLIYNGLRIEGPPIYPLWEEHICRPSKECH